MCLHLHSADVCRKFLYEPAPKGPVQRLQNYVVNREPGLVHTLMRNFTWHENVLFYQELGEVKNKQRKHKHGGI